MDSGHRANPLGPSRCETSLDLASGRRVPRSLPACAEHFDGLQREARTTSLWVVGIVGFVLLVDRLSFFDVISAAVCRKQRHYPDPGPATVPVLRTAIERAVMHPRATEFQQEAADRYGIEVDVHEFEEGTKTAGDAANVVGCDVAQIASGLVFDVDGEAVMVVTSGANRVSEDQLADTLGAESASMADPDLVREATGYGIGGVPPFCHENDVPVLIDRTLLDHDEVWAAAGTPEAIFPIDPETIVEVADATPADVTG